MGGGMSDIAREKCGICGKEISDDEYVVHWGSCRDCYGAHVQAALIELLSGMSDILEHDCDCPPCIGSMAPAEDLLGRSRALLAKLAGA